MSNGNNNNVHNAAASTPNPVSPDHFQGLEPRMLMAGTPTPGDSAMAYDNKGNLHLAYYDATAHNLKYTVQSAGNGAWSTPVIVDKSSKDVGQQVSLALDKNNRPAIAYRDAFNQDLKYAHFDGKKWVVSTVDAKKNTGINPSLAFDKQNHALISFYRPAFKDLQLTTQDSDLKNWTFITLASKAGAGSNSSVAVDPKSGQIAVAFKGSDGKVRFVDKAANANSFNKPVVVDKIDGVSELSLTFGPDKKPAFTYYDPETGEVKLATKSGKSFNVTAVATIEPGQDPGAKIIIDPSSGKPQVVFYDSANDGMYVANKDGDVILVAQGGGAGTPVVVDKKTGKVVFTQLSDNGTPQVQDTRIIPAAPSDLEATAVSTSQIDLTWSDNSDNESSFKVLRSTDDGVTWTTAATVAANSTSYSDTGLTEGTTYVYKVAAVGPTGLATLCEDAAGNTTLPAGPSALAAVATSPTSVSLLWSDNSAGETDFTVERSADDGATWTTIATLDANATAYTDTTTAEGIDYVYRVTASNDSGPSTSVIAAVATTVAAPTGLDASSPSATSVSLSWTNHSGHATGVIVERSVDGIFFSVVGTLPASANAFVDSTVTAGAQYTYRVKASGAAGHSAAALSAATRVRPSAPAVTATAVATTQVNLTWATVSGAVTYVVERSTDGGDTWTQLATPSTNHFNDDTAVEASSYHYRVRSVNAGGQSANSNAAHATTFLAAPSGLTLNVTGTALVHVTWTDNSTGETGFVVERTDDDGVTWHQVALTNPNATSFSDDSASEGAAYGYRVHAIKGELASDLTPASDVTTNLTAPDGLTATAVSLTQVDLSWTGHSTTQTGFEIYRSTDGGTSFALRHTADADESSFSDTVTEGGAYVYKVRAVNDATASTYTSTESATILPAAPSGLTGTVVSSTQVNLSWTDNSAGETGYRVEISDDSGASWSHVDLGVGVTTYNHTGATEGTQYKYRVFAVNDAGDSDASNVFTATTLATAASDFTATAVDADTVHLAWTDNSTHESGYIVERSDDNGATFTAVSSLLGADTTSFDDDSATAGTGYIYRVLAANSVSATTASNTATALTLPAAATAPAATAASDTTVNLTWTAVPSATSYTVERSDDSATSWATVGSPTATNAFSDTTAAEGTTYLYRVTAANATGTGAAGAASSAVTTFTAAPTDLTATPISATQVDLAWADHSNHESNYRVERSLNGGTSWSTVATLGASVTSFGDTTIANTSYSYRVIAVGAAGDSLPTSTQAVLTVPAAPGSVSAVASADLHATLSWTAVTGATGYTVERSSNGGSTWSPLVTLGNVLGYADTSAVEATSYVYRVAATNATGAGATTDSNAVTTLPSAATDLTATPVTTTRIDLSWTDNSGGETGYLVERSSNAGVNFTPLIVVSTNVTTYTDSPVTEGTAYVYRVKPVDITGTGAGITVNTATKPTAPTALGATPISANQVDLAWTDNSTHETGYVIERSDDNGTSWAPVHTTAADVASWSDTTVVGGHSYQYRLHATGVSSTVSADSNTVTTLTVPAAVTDLALSVVSDTQINVTWTDTYGETGYTLERYDGNSWSTVNSPAADANHFNDTTVVEGVTYTYRLTSANGTGSSAASNTPSATTLPTAPDTLDATSVDATHVSLTWADHSAHETAFVIERSDDNGVSWGIVHTTLDDVTTWTDATVVGGTSYQYRVTAKQGTALSTFSSPDTALTHPAAVATFTATAIDDTHIDLAWDAVHGADTYLVEYTDDNGANWHTSGTPSTNSLSIPDAGEATEYTFRVTPVNATGNGPTTSSNTITTYAAAPTNLNAVVQDSHWITVSWDDNSLGESGYRVERSADNGDHWTAFHTTDAFWEDHAVEPATTYLYRVIAEDDAGDSAVSNTDTKTTGPAAPANFAANPVSTTRVDLTWDAMPTATNYLIDYSTDNGITWNSLTVLGNVTSYSHTNATEATHYLYQISASSPGGYSDISDPVSAATFAALPTTVAAAPVDASHVTVSWDDNSAGETHYIIERSDDNGDNWSIVQTTAPDATSWSDATVTGGNSYLYRVTVTDAAGNSPAVAAAAAALTVPASVAGFAPTTLSTTEIDLAWTPAHGATGYVIEVYNGSTWDNVATISNPTTALYHVTDLAEATAYDFRIFAIDTTGSSVAATQTGTTLANEADDLVVTPVDNASASLTWDDNSGNEDGYKIQRSDDNGTSWTTVHTTLDDVTTWIDPGLAGGHSYQYRVLAFTAGGNSGPTNVETILTVPDAVADVAADATSASAVTITWTGVTGATLYTVRRSTDNGTTWTTAGTTASTTFNDTGRAEAHTYTYDVIAADTTGDGADSANDDALTRPAAPTTLVATGSATTTVDLTWADNSAAEDGYKIERSSDAGANWTLVHTTAADVTTWSDTLTESQAFLYRVFAFNVSGPSALSAEVTGTALPAIPTGATATATGVHDATVDWTDTSAHEDGFVIQRSDDGGSTWNDAGTVLADVHTFNDTAAPEGTAVQYRVRAYRNDSNSAWSNTATDDTLPAAPSTLVATASGPTTVDLTWADNSVGETGYDIYRSANDGVSWTKIHSIVGSATSYSDAAAPEDMALKYKIVASAAGGDSADSNVASATTPIAAPTVLTATAVSDTTIDLAWTDNSSAETGYKIYRSIDSGANWTLAHTTAAGANSWSDTGRTEDTAYTYKVVATDGTVDSDPSNTPSATTALTGPAITGISSPTATSVTITWSDNSLAEDGYKIERSDDNGSTWNVVQMTAAGVTTWTNTGLTEATQYKFRVRAFHGSNFSAYTAVSTLTTIPATPTTVSASPFSTTQIDITWADNSANESGYVVERSTDGGDSWSDVHTAAIDETSWSDPNAHEGADYVYRVRATGIGGDSAESGTSAATTAPTAPSSLTVNMIAANAVMISWADNSTGETGYEIERSTDNGSTFSPLATISSADQTSYTDETAAEATAYVYRVRAVRNAASSAWSNSTTQVTTLPAAATDLAVTTPTSTRAVLTWTDNSAGETGYKVQRSTDNGDTWTTIFTTLPSAITYSDNTVSEGHSYLYQVVAFNGTGDALSSNTASASMVPANPTGLSGSAANPNRIDLSWTDRSSAEAGYKVERSTNGGSTWTQVADLPADSNAWSDTTVNEATNYQYRVRAYNDAGNSGYTASVSITTPLKAPTTLVSTTVSATAISLTWTDNSSGETQYKVERSGDNGSTWNVIATLPSNSASYNDTGLSEGHAYQYRVRAAKTGNTSGYSNTVTPTTLPAAPTSLTATPASSTQVNLAWTDNSSGETGFVVERSSDNGTSWTQIATPAANATSYNDTTGAEGITYLYRVKAVNAGGSSAFVTSSAATTLPGAPTVLAAASPFGDTVDLSWTDNSTHETGFKIERSDDSGSTWTQIATVGTDVTTYSDTTVEEAFTYQYRVRANVNATNSSYSNTATVTTVPLAPDTLIATTVSQAEIDLDWHNNSVGHPTFKIERSEDGGITWSLVHTTGADATNWADTTVTEGLYYQYRVQAHNTGGDSAYSSTAEALTLPAAASNLAIYSADATEIIITWTDNSVGEEGFFVERQTDGGSWDLIATLGPDSNSHSDTDISTGHTYTYRVRAANSSGDAPDSNTDSATV